MRWMIALGGLAAAILFACSGFRGNGEKCSSTEGGSQGNCDPAVSFCGQRVAGSDFVCIPRPDQPWIQPDRYEMGFGAEFGTVVYEGTNLEQSLQLTNEGAQLLTLTGAALAGANPGQFSLEMSGPMPITVESRKSAFARVTYKAPNMPSQHEALLVIKSDSDNAATLNILLRATAAHGPPTEISIISGDAQSGSALRMLSAPFVVKVKDALRHPLPGITVNFAASTDGASVTPTWASTAPDGTASAVGTPTFGSNKFSATIEETPGPLVTFTATGL